MSNFKSLLARSAQFVQQQKAVLESRCTARSSAPGTAHASTLQTDLCSVHKRQFGVLRQRAYIIEMRQIAA